MSQKKHKKGTFAENKLEQIKVLKNVALDNHVMGRQVRAGKSTNFVDGAAAGHDARMLYAEKC